MKELVSVLMTVYKEPIAWVKQAVTSILSQTYANVQFVIVLDNPEHSEVNNLLLNYAKDNSKIVYIRNEQNLGLVKSLNIGLQYCSGEYIARMDADDISHKDRIEKQMQYLKKYDLDLVGSHSYLLDNDCTSEMKTVYTNRACNIVLKYCPCMVHPSWFGKRKVFDLNQGYREFEACEDYEFAIRAVLNGFKIGNTEEILFTHRYNKNSISNTKVVRQKCLAYYIAKDFRKNKYPFAKNGNYYTDSKDYKKTEECYAKMLENSRGMLNFRIKKQLYLFKRKVAVKYAFWIDKNKGI